MRASRAGPISARKSRRRFRWARDPGPRRRKTFRFFDTSAKSEKVIRLYSDFFHEKRHTLCVAEIGQKHPLLRRRFAVRKKHRKGGEDHREAPARACGDSENPPPTTRMPAYARRMARRRGLAQGSQEGSTKGARPCRLRCTR